MRRLLPTILIFIFPIFLNAQKGFPQRDWAISFTPAIVPLPGDGHFGIQPGIYYQLNMHLSILAEVTFQIGNHSDPYVDDKNYLRIKPEIKYFFSRTKEFGDYLGLQVSFTKRDFRSNYGYYHDHLPDDSVVYYDQARINSPILTASIQFGCLVSLGDAFMLDYFIGAGIRSINTGYTEVVNPHVSQIIEESGRWRTGYDPAYYYSGQQIRFHPNFGIRFLYFLPHI